MAITFKVTVISADGLEFIMETFETSSDADKFFNDLQEDKDGILDAILKVKSPLILTLEEFYNGAWTQKSRRTVR